jgi:hypothetical protein
MAQTLEERVEELEKKFSELSSQTREASSKDWLRTFGMSRGDQGFDEMIQLGREYRRKLGHENNGSHS